MPGSIVASAVFGLVQGTVAYAATAFAVNLVASQVVSKLIMKNAQQGSAGADQRIVGNRIQLSPATNNKLPVIYGSAWTNPIITDCILSEDNQTMWYVLTFAEKTATGTISFDKIYWADKLLSFDPANPNEILGWWDDQTQTFDERPAGKIQMYFYNNGSANVGTPHLVGTGTNYVNETNLATTVLSDAGIAEAQRWSGTDAMTDTVFAIVKMKYDQNVGITGLPTITAKIVNSLKQPGDVMVDYLINSRYGCNISLSNIDTDTTNALNTYSGQTITVTNAVGGASSTATRFEINGIIDTRQSCLDNLVNIADTADSWVQWNEKTAKWGVKINQSLAEGGLTTSSPRIINTASIIGGINISPLDLNQTYNKFRVEFPNKEIKDQADYRYYTLDSEELSPNEPDNEMTLQLPLCNNSTQADYIGRRRLFSSREDYIINFTMDYSGIQIDAGDIIVVQHDWYGWNQGTYGSNVYQGKPFRVTQVREQKDSDGFLSVVISANSYNDTVYSGALDDHTFTQANFSVFDDPGFISDPPAPTFPATFIDTTASSYVIEGFVPTIGNVVGMEFWYSIKGAELTTENQYVWYDTQSYNNGALYPKCPDGEAFLEQTKAVSFAAADYWWRTRAVGPTGTKSNFSTSSVMLAWVPAQAVDGEQILDNTLTGNKVSEGDSQLVGRSDSGGFFDGLGKVALAGLGASAMYYGYKKGWLDEMLPMEADLLGGGNNPAANDLVDLDVWATTSTATIGETITVVADATPHPGDIEDYTDWGDFAAEPFNANTSAWGGDFDFGD